MEKDLTQIRNEHWKDLFPEICLYGILGRIQRIARHHDTVSAEAMKQFGLKNCEADVLGALLFSGSPYRLQPKEITKYVYRSAGAITNVLDHLEKKGLILRTINAESRRSIIVELTPEGKEVAKASFFALVDNENDLLEMLDDSEKQTLSQLLKKILMCYEK